MNSLKENKIFNMCLNKLISDESLYNEINRADSIIELSYLLQVECERVQTNISKRRNFSVAKILECEIPCMIKMKALTFALNIQGDNGQLEYCIDILNEKLSMLDLDLAHQWDDIDIKKVSDSLWLAAAIIDVDIGMKNDCWSHLNISDLKNFILKMFTLKTSKEFPIDKFSLFLQYYKVLSSRDPPFTDEILQYCIDQENVSLLCLLFEKDLRHLVTCSFFQKDFFWNFLKIHIVSENSVKKKQVEYILWISIEYIKIHSISVPKALVSEPFKSWDFFFIILEMSKEKQLHLIQPSMKLLPLVSKLNISWQRCLYQELLKHSQITVVYDIAKYLLKFDYTCDDIHQELIGDILKALNKSEYSHLSREVFSELSIFCNKLSEDCYLMFLDEFVKIDWNPSSAWSVLKSSLRIFKKCPQEFLIKMLLCLNKLPHTCIKKNCIMLFIKEVLNNALDILQNLVIIAKFLLSTNQEIDKNMLYYIIQDKREELEKFSERLEEIALRSAKNENLENLIASLELLRQLDKNLENNSIMSISNSGDVILFNYPNILEPLKLQSYILERVLNVNDFDKQFFLKLLKLLLNLDLLKISNEKYLDIWKKSENDANIRFFVSYLICRSSDIDSVLFKQAETFLENFKFQTMQLHIENLRKLIEKQHHNGEINEILQKLLALEIDDESNLTMIIENFDLIIKYIPVTKPFIQILDRCIRKIFTLQNNLMRRYSIVFFQSLFLSNLFSNSEFVKYWETWCTDLFDFNFMDCGELIKIILEGCRDVILLGAPYASILIPVIFKASTEGIVVQKNQRVEYGICQEIHDSINLAFVENPNIISSEIKILSMECLYLLAKSKSNKNVASADCLMEKLVAVYMVNYNKRYFPDSKIHIEKLRIVQAMLLLVNLTKKCNDQIVQFIMKSLSEESHQHSVKQLLQWLLIILASGAESNLRMMIEKVRCANASNPSFIVALIPVIYHLMTSFEDEELWFEVTDALLPLLMGANFKLRVYAQVTLLNILKKSRAKQFETYINRYLFLEKTIRSVLDATGKNVQETLKNDLPFIENFDKDLHYSIENIFVVLPQMLDVPPYEWQNILEHRFSEQFDIKIKTEHKLPYKIFQNINENRNDPAYSVNVQKKIIPWRQELDDKLKNKSLNNLICVASLVEKNSNIGGLSRTCEIFNVKQLVLHNIKIRDDREFKNLSMSSENWVDFIEVKKDDLSNFLRKLRGEGYSIIGLEQTSESVKLNEFKFEEKSVILLGNEKEGIPAPLLPLLDTCVEIPQFGQTRSLNVHVAGATFIWEYVKQHML